MSRVENETHFLLVKIQKLESQGDKVPGKPPWWSPKLAKLETFCFS